MPPSSRDPALDRFAKEWSGTQAAAGNIFHRSNLAAVAAGATAEWQGIAENVGFSSGVELATVDQLHVSFMNSPGHAANVVGNYNRVGIGIVHSAGATYITLNFLRGPALPTISNEGPAKTWAPSGFVPISPVRLVDTRNTGAVGGGGTLAVRPAAVVGAANGATAVAVNVTVIGPGGGGFATVYPCGSARPTASSLNFVPGDIRPNLVEVALGGNGDFCIFTSAPANFAVDLAGYYTTSGGSRYQPQSPRRLLDTRNVSGPVNTASVRIPGGGGGAAMNVTVTDPTAAGFVTVWPCDGPRPNASNLNFRAGETIPNLVMSRTSGAGDVCLFASAATHLIVDLQGTFSGVGGLTVPAEPRRAMDSRIGLARTGPIVGNPNAPAELNLRSSGRVPANAVGAILNVTVTEPSNAGWVTAYPCASGLPTSSNLNFSRGQTVANNVIAALDSNGKVCLAGSTPTQIVVDVVGWLA